MASSKLDAAVDSVFPDTSKSRSGVPYEGLEYEDYFGAEHIYRSLTSKSVNDEESAHDTEHRVTEESPPFEQVRRRGSTVVSAIQSISKKLGFWDDEFLSQRISIIVTLLQNYIFLITGFICVLCLYWGSYYNRASHYKNLYFAVVVADAEVGSLTPVLGEIVSQFFQQPTMKAYGSFDMWNYTRISSLAIAHNNSIEQEVLRQVHHQHYLAAFYVHENATAQMYDVLSSRNASFNPSTDLLSVFYETGSDYNAMTNYVSSILQTICLSFVSAMRTGPWTPFWMEILDSDQAQQILSQTPSLLTSLPNFLIIDELPVIPQVVQAPLQIGLIYLCMFTFFQYLFCEPIHKSVAAKIKDWRFVVFRIATAQGAYFVLSLSYVVLNTAFGIDFTRTFGNSGFLVIWAIAFLTMSSVGSAIEILVLVCIVLKPAMVGVCLLLVAILNLAPTISPIYLCPEFYRYGYAMPIYNSYHLLQAAYFNSWKGHMGRYFGILVAWSLVTNSIMPFVMRWVSKKMQKRKLAAVAISELQDHETE
ncbi:hypothetical protein METBIDRAFT_78926 [Metschnikowia bicuspidata var. bicuspidata NRRL YB-4993]|uniref:DUF3533 domain-containing protein n=1 Tax=Metschnikowia bicuspidata var. bicuspidata NRRL YB-4993 TaxID=869754 RepID=A0A1A0H9M4_9ASCO|nr:hypothetical protein METBIDRAFT_78926 [Metschnikowia bicuspidata var. bicuspidata NRRL YB-4993]OBA20587.1 hypothetical protein METBIDRAFT_78926 [Metschnikowia bicuspidata var. bicuspidata NRRL YB-4993]